MNKPVIVVGAVAAAVAGWWFFIRKPPVVLAEPGAVVDAHVSLRYRGPARSYVVRVNFGDAVNGFTVAPGMSWDLPIALGEHIDFARYDFVVSCTIPVGAVPGIYDAEALILLGAEIMARTVVLNAIEIT